MSQWGDPVVPGGTNDFIVDLIAARKMRSVTPTDVDQKGRDSPVVSGLPPANLGSFRSGQPRRRAHLRILGHRLAQMAVEDWGLVTVAISRATPGVRSRKEP
jgi:hypothetical protein